MPENDPSLNALLAADMRRLAKHTKLFVLKSCQMVVDGHDRLFAIRDQMATRAANRHPRQ